MSTDLTRALRMEWRRIRTVRSSWLIALLAIASSTGLAAAVTATTEGPIDLGLATSVINPGQPAPTPVLLGILGVLAWGHDHRYGTIRPVLGVTPHRSALVAARFLVATVWFAAVAALAVGGAWVAGLIASGGDLGPFLTQDPLPRMVFGSVVFGVGCGWLGLGIGALIRSLPVAIAGLFALPAIIEPMAVMILRQVHAGAENWLPFYASGQFVARTPVPDGPSIVAAVALFLGIGVALAIASAAVLDRRDA
jgi:ABC-2 type transport system permease protein